MEPVAGDAGISDNRIGLFLEDGAFDDFGILIGCARRMWLFDMVDDGLEVGDGEDGHFDSFGVEAPGDFREVFGVDVDDAPVLVDFELVWGGWRAGEVEV